MSKLQAPTPTNNHPMATNKWMHTPMAVSDLEDISGCSFYTQSMVPDNCEVSENMALAPETGVKHS